MKLERWDTKEVIFEMECDSLGDLLTGALKANISFYRANFKNADFSFYDFRGSDFSSSNFRGSDFSDSNFRGSYFSSSNFRGSDFSGSDFSYSNFRGSQHQYKIGNMKEWKSMQLEKYMVVFNTQILCIGCK